MVPVDGRTGPPGVSFGVALYTGQQPSARARPHYGDAGVLARASEDAGFDVFWVSEHHGFPDGYLPSPLVLLAALAQATRTIGLGTGVVVGPLCHPVRLAEEASVVDNLSGGRLVLGLGAGYHERELRTFGVEPSQRGGRLDETLEILRLSWEGEPFSWSGTHFELADARVTPTPVRPGGIPVWLGGYAPAALRRAARCADGHLVGRGDPEVVRESAARLRLQLAGRTRPFTFAANVTVLLTDDGGSADAARRGFSYQQAAYERIQAGSDVYAGRVGVTRHGDGDDLALGSIDRYVHVAGSGPAVVEALLGYLDDLRGFDHVHLALRLLFPEDDTPAQVERIALAGRAVLAPLRARLAMVP